MQPLRFVGLAILAASIPAQSFYVPTNTPTVGTANVFPFGTTDMRYQALVLASELGSTPAVIRGFGLAPANTGVRTFTHVTMKMAHLASSSLSTTFDQNLAAGAVTTMDVANWAWPLTANTWNDVDLQVPFVFNGVDNVVVEFLVQGSAGINGGMHRDSTNQRVYQGSYTGQLTGTNGGLSAFKMRFNLGDASSAAFGLGCPASNQLVPALTFGGSSQLGQTLDTNLGNALPSSVALLLIGLYMGQPFPVDLAIIGAPGCFAYFPNAASFAVFTDPVGAGSYPLPIPNNTAFTGLCFYEQWAVLDSITGGLSVSNYGRVQVGI